MRILVVGAAGRLGSVVVQALQDRGHNVEGVDLKEVDITDFRAAVKAVRAASPEAVIHCAAMTQVDRCAEMPDEANRVNGLGTQHITLACQVVGAAMCYISTNEVFDGEKGAPYLEYDVTRPINAYGYSKWMGERAVLSLLPQHYIVRTAWLFAHNGANFMQRIVSLAREGKPLSVVTDEVANPTYTDDLAQAISDLISTRRYGIYHLVNEGEASRYDFARFILDTHGLQHIPIAPIKMAQFNRPSRPPAYSPLRNFIGSHVGIRLRPWQDAVTAFVEKERLG